MRAAEANGWRKVKLKQVCREVTVGHVGPMAKEYVSDGIPFLRSQNIRPFSIDSSTVKYISSVFHARLKKSTLHPGDVVIVRTGYPGTACVIPASLPVANCADLVIVRPSDELNPVFLTAVFNSAWGMGRVSGSLVGVAQQHFNITVAKEMEIYLPPLPVQKRIAAILSAYNDLIENNLRRIRILEEMAQALYREWFVHFRFPGHEKAKTIDSPFGKIPEGWEVVKVDDAFEITGGGTPSKKVTEYWGGGTIMWYVPSDLTAAGTMFMDSSPTQITELGLKKSSAHLFPPFSLMMTSRATIGVVSINTTPACTNQGFITCMPNERVPLYYLYFWVRSNVDTFLSLASGTTFKEIIKRVFRRIDFLRPPAETLVAFEALVRPVGEQILNLQRKNANLRRTRDLLLPRLTSGEVDVSDLDVATKPVGDA